MKIIRIFWIVVLFSSLSIVSRSQSIEDIRKEVDGVCVIDENDNVSYQRVIEAPGLSKNDIFTLLRNYFTYHYVDSQSVLKVQDKENGILLAHGIYTELRGSNHNGSATNAWHIIRVDVKDGKARVIITLTDYELPSSVIFGIVDKVSKTCPISPTFNNKKWWARTFYRAHTRVLKSFAEIENTLKETNTSTKIENDNW